MITPRGVDTTDDPDDFAQTVYDELNRSKELLTAFDRDDARLQHAGQDDLHLRRRSATLTRCPRRRRQGQSVRNVTTYTYFDNGWTQVLAPTRGTSSPPTTTTRWASRRDAR